MSRCGGALYGYYNNDSLVYLESTSSSESGYSRIHAYIQNGIIDLVVLEEHFPDRDIESNAMDTSINYVDSKRILIHRDNKYEMVYKKNKLQSMNDDASMVESIIECVNSMRTELKSEKIDASMR